jgi:hypothetical protein
MLTFPKPTLVFRIVAHLGEETFAIETALTLLADVILEMDMSTNFVVDG